MWCEKISLSQEQRSIIFVQDVTTHNLQEVINQINKQGQMLQIRNYARNHKHQNSDHAPTSALERPHCCYIVPELRKWHHTFPGPPLINLLKTSCLFTSTFKLSIYRKNTRLQQKQQHPPTDSKEHIEIIFDKTS